MYKKIDGFKVEISSEGDQDYLAQFVELPNIFAFGTCPDHALSELNFAWEVAKKSYRKCGKEIPSPEYFKYFSFPSRAVRLFRKTRDILTTRFV